MAREIAKFGVVGALGVFVNFAVFNLMRHSTDLQVVRASVIATVVAIAFNYVGFRYFTYRDRDKSGRAKELTLFLLFSVVGLVIENGVLYAATYGFGWDSSLQSNIFKFLGMGLATLFRFWSYRTWVFRALPAREAVASAESFLEGPVAPAPAAHRVK
ncbi:GtrA family protein [Streptomyces sp. VRA16 Mangrove soil]|uniref:GtrA family protein n=1 Tax=Streptomyces sp. VRA16 Mangrove soil TaxID=2817434 RepID=UPI0035ABF7CA